MIIQKADTLKDFRASKNFYVDMNIFFSDEYSDCKRTDKDLWFLLYSDCFVMPILISCRYFFKYAALISEPVRYNYETEEEYADFIGKACEFLNKNEHVQWVNPTYAYSFFEAYPEKSYAIPFGNYVIDLKLSLSDIFANMHSKHRNSVRKAEKDGVDVRKGSTELLDDYMLLDRQTWKRSNQSGHSKEYYCKIMDSLKDNAVIYIAYKDNIPQNGALFYYNNVMCYYMYGASCDKPYTGAGNLLHWKAITDMKENGVDRYSFVGCRINEDKNSKYHQIQRFKERFGGVLIKGFMFKMEFNPVLHALYKMLLSVKNKGLSSKDIIDQEIIKFKNKAM